MPINSTAGEGARSFNEESFQFVRALAAELSKGRVQLPSYPEVALRVQRTLSNDNIDVGVVVRAIGAEPSLALRVIQMGNSVLLNPSGRPVDDLRAAVGRIGYNMVRSASVAFVMEQLRNSAKLKPLRHALDELWQRSVAVAAFAQVIARRHTTLNPDTALLAGLLQGVGKLYILSRLSDHPRLQQHPEACRQIIDDWHPGIARALLENWELSEEVAVAVQDYPDLERDLRGSVALSEVLTVSALAADFVTTAKEGGSGAKNVADLLIRGERFWTRLHIDRAKLDACLKEADEELTALRAALGT